MKQEKKKTGRPTKRPIDMRFKKIFSYKRKVTKSETNLLMSLYYASCKMTLTGKKRTRNLIKNNLPSLTDLRSMAIGDLSSEDKQSIIQMFEVATKKFLFQSFGEKNMPTKLFNQSYDLSFVFFKIISGDFGRDQLSAQQQVFLCLLCLLKRNELLKQLLVYFTNHMSLILHAVAQWNQQLSAVKLQDMAEASNYVDESNNESIEEQECLVISSYINASDSFSNLKVRQQLNDRINNQIIQDPDPKTPIKTNKGIQKKTVGRRVKKLKKIKKVAKNKKSEGGEGKCQIDSGSKSTSQKKKKQRTQQQSEDPDLLAINFSKYICFSYYYARVEIPAFELTQP